MTPQEALDLLNNVTAQVSASRSDHGRIQQAIEVLLIAIAPKDPDTVDGDSAE